MDKKKLCIVTEVGSFGDLNVADPTEIEIEGEDTDIDEIIKGLHANESETK